jgi:hypothetical protein
MPSRALPILPPLPNWANFHLFSISIDLPVKKASKFGFGSFNSGQVLGQSLLREGNCAGACAALVMEAQKGNCRFCNLSAGMDYRE